MAVTYRLRDLASDLAGGADFSSIADQTPAAAVGLVVSVAKAVSEDSVAYTRATEPGLRGTSTGTFTVNVNVTTGNTSISLAVALARVNSAGTQQAITAFTAAQAATAGPLTFTFTDPALGAWAAGDRLKIVYRFTNSQTMSAQSCTIEANTISAEIATPFTAPTPIGTLTNPWSAIDTAAYTVGGTPAASIVNDQLSTAANETYPSATTKARYSLHESAVYVQLDTSQLVSQASGAQPQTFIICETPEGYRAQLSWTGVASGSPYLLLREQSAGPTYSDTSVVHDPVAHARLRFRESAGVLYWEACPLSADPTDPASWTVLRSKARLVDLTQVTYGNGAGSSTGAALATSGGVALYDNINLAGVNTVQGSAALAAAAALSVGTIVVGRAAAAALSAGAALTATPAVSRSAAVSMGAGAALTAAPTRERPASAALVASSSLSATPTRIVVPTVALAAASALAVGTITHVRAASAALVASAALTSAPTVIGTQQGSAALVASSSLTATPTRTQPAAASLVASQTTTAQPTRSQLAAAALTASQTTTATATRVQPASAALSASHVLAAEATTAGQQNGAAALTASHSTGAAAVVERLGAASLVASATLSSAAIRERPAAASLTASAQLVADAVRVVPAAVALGGSHTLSTTALVELAAAAALTQLHTLGALPTIGLTASPPASVGRTAGSTAGGITRAGVGVGVTISPTRAGTTRGDSS